MNQNTWIPFGSWQWVGFVKREKNYLPTTAPESKSKPTYWSSPTQGHPATISYWKKNRYKAHTQELLAGPQHKQPAKGVTYFISSILRLPFFFKIYSNPSRFHKMDMHGILSSTNCERMTMADPSFTIFSRTKVLWMNEKSINNAKEGKSLCISIPRKITH